MHENQFSVFENVCSICNGFKCSCQTTYISEIDVSKIDTVTANSKSSDHVAGAQDSYNFGQVYSNNHLQSCNTSSHSVNLQTNNENPFSINLQNKGYNIGHLNIQGICGNNLCKFSELSIMLSSKDYENLHIFGLSETKLKDHKMTNIFKINGFQTPFRKDNNINGGGGIIVYVRDGINAKRREDLETNDISCIWLEISPVKGKSFLVGNMYRPPDSKVEYNDRFENFIDNVLTEEKEFLLLGDFNKNLFNEDTDRDWGNFTTSLGLTQLINEPTRVTKDSKTLIDHIYTTNEENIRSVKVEKICVSDHYAIFCNRSSHISPDKANQHQTITYRSFKNFVESNFLNDLNSVPWEIIESFDDVDDIVSAWMTLFTETLDKHAPIKSHRIKRKYQPDWLTPEILDLIKDRNKCKLNGNMEGIKILRNKVTAMIDIAKKETYQCKIEEGKNDPRSIWKIFNEVGMKNKENDNASNFKIKVEDDVITKDSEVAEVFNNYFINIASKLKEPVPNSDFIKLNNFIRSKVPNEIDFQIPFTNQTFIRKFLLNLNVRKSTGLDNIGPRILKLSANIITPSLEFIINKSISTGKFPSVWKEAKVKPMFKNGNKEDVNNYRPISILPTISKIIEKWVENQFSKYLNEFNLLHKTQSGFRPKHSTESALILMIDSWLKAINEGKIIGCVLVDFRKAFDLVDHHILLKKLQCYKCNESCLSWFDSYLSQRTQRVSLNSTLSDPSEVIYGVPQGSILGPLLFLLFINDLPLFLQNNSTFVDLYADDTTVYYIDQDKSALERHLQSSLDSLQKWCRQNGMVLNTEKTKVMLIMSRQKRTIFGNTTLNLQHNDIDICMTSCDKILGIHVDHNLNWHNHFKFLSKKISSYLWLLSKIRTYVSIDHRLLFYNAYIKPHFDYCSMIWSNSSNVNINKVTKLQRRACKIILGHEYSDLNGALEKLKMLSFDQSVFLSKAKMMYKIHNNLVPSYLHELFLMRDITLDNTTANLRSVTSRNYIVPQAKCNLFKGSLSYSGVMVWNSIPVSIKCSNSLPNFVKQCSEWIRN